jgi:hypothetical protein
MTSWNILPSEIQLNVLERLIEPHNNSEGIKSLLFTCACIYECWYGVFEKRTFCHVVLCLINIEEFTRLAWPCCRAASSTLFGRFPSKIPTIGNILTLFIPSKAIHKFLRSQFDVCGKFSPVRWGCFRSVSPTTLSQIFATTSCLELFILNDRSDEQDQTPNYSRPQLE